jgi:hypothetical protein
VEKPKMDKSYSSLMPVVQSLYIEKDSFKPWDDIKGSWDLKFHILVPLDPPTQLVENQEYLSISPRHHTLLDLFW